MNPVVESIRANPLFRAAIVAPIAIMIIFSLFNLTSATDQSRIPAAVTVGVVNLDDGVPDGPRISEQLLAGMQEGLPFRMETFADEAAARASLEEGDVSAVLVVPSEFSRGVIGQTVVDVRMIATDHLSLAETQLGRSLSGQVGAALSVAIANVRLAAANGAFPPQPGATPDFGPAAVVSTEVLYAAGRPEALPAPFVMTYATWLAAFVGSLMIFLSTRSVKGPGTLVPVGAVRSVMPLLVPAVASLALAVVVAWTTDNWDAFLQLWLFVWLATSAITLLVVGLFAVFGFFAIVIALPVAFYQSALSGTQAPLGAIPDWLQPIAEALPFADLGAGYRALVIGGPEGSIPIGLMFAVAVAGIALIWLGTWVYHAVLSGRTAPASG